MEPIGIIGGSGFYDLLENREMFIHDSIYGRSSEIFSGTLEGRKVYFIPRHGPNHHVPVPRIPYRANMYAFYELGVRRVLATNAVGSMNPDIHVGDLVIPDDFCDLTRRYPRSMYDNTHIAYHVDMVPAYCPHLRNALIDAARIVKPGRVHDHGVLFVDEGLRFQTPFELRLFRRLGGDLIGMTTLPEAVFARELAMCYAHICCPTNWSTGDITEAASFPEVLKQGVEDFKNVLKIAVRNLGERPDCVCSHALDAAILSKEDGAPVL